MARYSPQERKGVVKVESICINELDWIFREQPLVDVGIDAIIEEQLDGNPLGKFIAAQIKTGESHIYETPDHFTYYFSSVHKEYWTNLNINFILIIHLPERNLTIWEKITSNNIKKGKTNWKIDICKKNIFSSNSKNKLQILFRKEKKIKFQLAKNINIDGIELQIQAQSIKYLLESLKSISDLVIKVNILLSDFIKSNKFNFDRINLIKGFNILHKKFESEIAIFALVFFESMSNTLIFEKLKKQNQNHLHVFKEIKISLDSLSATSKKRIPDFENLNNKILDKNITMFIEVFTTYCNEIEVASGIIDNTLNQIEN